jgi:Zn-dependent metalloprotease
VFAQGASPRQAPLDQAGINRLVADSGGTADVSVSGATGAARFVRITPGRAASLDAAAPRAAASARTQSAQTSAQESTSARATRSMAFLRRYAGVFGLSNPDSELALASSSSDSNGGSHFTYVQRYAGLPVLGGVLKTHFSGADELTAVNGTVVPQLAVDIKPTRNASTAGATAVSKVSTDKGRTDLAARGSRLIVFREGLLKGVPGDNHLTWEVEVGDGAGVREFVYVDAHSGKVIDQITGVQDDLFRRAYDGQFLPTVPPSYPGAPYWVEGAPFPTASTEANNMIISSKETYDFFHMAFGRDSFDGAGATMDSIFNRGYSCPNASWNGTFISFCNGFTTDDVTAHEWGHAYTQYTDNLIYAWQSGALNEAYSDIWGETIDQLNGRGFDTPGLRTDNSCTTYQTSSPAPLLFVNSPAAIAGEYDARGAAFGGGLPDAGLTSDLVLATPSDGCTPITNGAALAGKVAVMDRGVCGFAIKVKAAQVAGAIGVVMVNNVAGAPITMGGADPTITIPSLMVSLASGNTIKANLPGVNATLKPSGLKIDNTVRWLLGEEVGNVAGTGALRDMWNPTCYSNPGKVSDRFYYCDTADQGGVHTNSGVPNHTYALLTDGGSYNGQTVSAIGLTKAAHIHFRAQATYLVPTSDFFDHADALEQSCADLIGVNLANLQTGAPSGQIITAGDCQQVAKAALATELRTAPVQCNFQPLLAPNPPARCAPDTTQVNIFKEDFERNPAHRWALSHEAVTPADFTERDWVWTSDVPHGGTGKAFFGADPNLGTCAPGGDESAVLHLDSPAIALPNGVTTPLVEFDHHLATEAGWDGGNVKVSVNGGPWQVVAASAFTFNPYNATLQTVAAGNTNPLAGQPAFSGTDGGTNSGSWGRSYIDLTTYATAGDSVRLRFDIGNDGCTGVVGWYVDNVTVHACTANAEPTITINDINVTEGNSGFTQGKFTVSLSHAYAKPVTVFYFTFDGTARLLSDYLPTLGVITIPPLSVSKTLPVAIIGDRRVEPDEKFFVGLIFPINGMIANGVGACKIVNDDGGGTH